MNDIAIQVRGLGKQYHIGGPQKVYSRLGDQLADAIASPLRRAGKLLRGQATGAAELDETIWALKDISFDVRHGEVVGIIGRNGAGKSTLLKILSRITEPTEGYADIYGRVGSLLEVGTGFHPELTGRENIYLNGAILGMRKVEIDRKFDEIVAFAEIERFIDTPVKHYSSGMYVRLAFAVAAHLEPEILLVDEVLAVGDVAFQRKCLGKMDDVARQGRTVLFVSHNMGLMQTLCPRGILLHDGSMAREDAMPQVVDAYLRTLEQASVQDLSQRSDRKGRGQVRLRRLEILDGQGQPAATLVTGQPARFVFHVDGLLPGLHCVVVIFDNFGRPVAKFQSNLPGPEDRYDASLGARFICDLAELLLVAGRYRIDVGLRDSIERQDHIEAAAVFNVEEGQLRGRTVRPSGRNRVSVHLPHRWTLPTEDS